jgi:hypothetical protein
MSYFVENGTWIRAIQLRFWNPSDPLFTAYTSHYATRFNPGHKSKKPFEVLYLAENLLVASYEVGALLGNPYSPGGAFANPRSSWVFIPVQVHLQCVADLTLLPEQVNLATTVQELTGDWRGYDIRGMGSSVPVPVGIAPTQELGETFSRVPPGVSNPHPFWEGFRAVSARVTDSKNLIVYPQNLLKGSWLEFTDPKTGTVYRIDGTI